MIDVRALDPDKALNRAYRRSKPNRLDLERFKLHFSALLGGINPSESEEFHKNLVIRFLSQAFYSPGHFINTKGRSDLVIHHGKTAKTPVGVLVEVKKPTNKGEMCRRDRLDSKAMRELLLYYLRERCTYENLDLRHLVITNIHEWYVIDAVEFERLFVADVQLMRHFRDFEAGRLSGTSTDYFYKEIAGPAIQSVEKDIKFTWFDIASFRHCLDGEPDAQKDASLVPIFKVFSPQHLLKQPFANDSNTLDRAFYAELLHILGLAEMRQGSKEVIGRKKPHERDAGSLIENTITQLLSLGKLRRLEGSDVYGRSDEERLFNVALELVITWVNRLLFAKLLEAQVRRWKPEAQDIQFLTSDRMRDFDDVNKLFFRVLAVPRDNRDDVVRESYANVPYLNSSLFEPTDLEHQTLVISGLEDFVVVPIHRKTVLKDEHGKRLKGELPCLEYLLKFLEAYDFSSEESGCVQESNKTLISASVLGLIFEKINGYRDGAYFTPGFITEYMCRDSLRRAVVRRFNEVQGWYCSSLADVYERLGPSDRAEANRIINSLRICDPAVGSGHFLVSALNEIILIKHELRVLCDREGKWLKEYQVEVVNDEMYISADAGIGFRYIPGNTESQRVQEALFHEKREIIERCLFGVDVNPTSVKICRLRLWIELLKHAYYRRESGYAELETLPNIDINIKCGNSLIRRFHLDSDIAQALRGTRWTIDGYRALVSAYHHAADKVQKAELEERLDEIKEGFRSVMGLNDPLVRKRNRLTDQLMGLLHQRELFELNDEQLAEKAEKRLRLESEIAQVESDIRDAQSDRIYGNAFEWRFEFPEVLSEDGQFIGFDVVIGNPPYIKEYEGRERFDGLRSLDVYQGKIDMWYLFASLGLDLLQRGGVLAFIAPNNWTTSAGAKLLRSKILSSARIEQMVDFGPHLVFESAGIQTMILILSKDREMDEYQFDYSRLLSVMESPSLVHEFLGRAETVQAEYLRPLVSRSAGEGPLVFNDSNVEGILRKMDGAGNMRLDGRREVAQGIVAPQDSVNRNASELLGVPVGTGVFVLSDQELEEMCLPDHEREIVEPLFTTAEMKRYYAHARNRLWVIYTDSSFRDSAMMESYPLIRRHLDRFQPIITSDNRPYGLHRARERRFFDGPRIVSARKCQMPTFTYIEFTGCVLQTFNIIKTPRVDLKYLTSLLNSRLARFYFRFRGKMQGAIFQIDNEPLSRFPIRTVENLILERMRGLVDDACDASGRGDEVRLREIEDEMDREIYKIYGIDESEAEFILTTLTSLQLE